MHRIAGRWITVAAVAAALLLQTLPATAGTTGSIGGTVLSTENGTPIAGATVVATSPSQTSTTTTDASGRFTMLSLAPDTYTIAVTKAGFSPNSTTGVSIFADQIQNIRIGLQPALKNIATVTSRSSMDLVKQGTTTDVYSVNATVTKAAQGLGGGGNLNNAYSAIATVPGAFVPPNQQGWDQVVYIRGGNFDQVGYEFDGVPVNRSFDNYPGGTAGTLGQQQLQVYAGGGTAGESASGLAGFINQVTKTGTYPGYADANFGMGTPTFYHNFNIEAGGSTPDRLFSYYVGVGGYNQDFRYLDQFNGSSFGNVWGFPVIAYNTTYEYNLAGVYPTCVSNSPNGKNGKPLYTTGPNGSPVYDPYQLQPGQPGYITPPPGNDPGCYQTISPAYASYSNLSDRETVVNLHFGIPHKRDAGRDDVQMLYTNDMLLSQYYSSANDLGPDLVRQLNQLDGLNSPEVWGDFATWAPGTAFASPAGGAHAVPYMAPASPTNRCANTPAATVTDTNGFSNGVTLNVPGACPAGTFSAVPADTRDGFWNNASIVKLQYQHNMGSTAYIRIYGYTFYSDWLQNGPLSYGTDLFGLGVLSYDYELESHTRGLAFSFADQLSSTNQITLDANYTTASTNRYNNNNFNNSLTAPATNLVSGFGRCVALYSATYLHVKYAAGQQAPCNSPLTSGSFIDPSDQILCQQNALFPTQDPQCLSKLPAGSAWQVTYTGQSGFLNNVQPNFTSVALEDRWRPSDRLDINIGLRDEVYQYDLSNTSNDGQNFWFAAGQNEFCYNPVTLAPYVIPARPASGLPSTPFVGLTCPVDRSIPASPVQTVHPDGKSGHLLLSNSYTPTLSQNAFTPSIGATYTLNNDTVLRVSAGRYAQEPETYQVQYNAKDNNLAYDLFQAFWQYGYTTPKHDPLVQYSNNYDASLESRIKGTDMSFKLTPYYRYATNQIYSIALPFGLSGGLNSGIERVDGVEFAFTKGDFNKNGLSFLFSYTYTNAAEQWANFPNTSINPIDPYNQDIANFNGLTKAGGGSQCYINNSVTGKITADPSCAGNGNANKGISPAILNPYYNMAKQPLLDRNAWYPVGLDFAYLSPNTATALVNYKHNKFTITPGVTFNEGQLYGNPASVVGIDPRTCTSNSAIFLKASPKTNVHQADYTTCGAANTQNGSSPGTLFIPDPSTGTFDSFGQFRQPSQLNLSVNLSYQINPRISVTAVLSNLLNACFGGTATSWSKQYPPNGYSCGYIPNGYYVANFYNGTSPNDVKANGVPLNSAFSQPYIPAWADTNSFVLPGPFNMVVQMNIKI
jgi:hypothetical protein